MVSSLLDFLPVSCGLMQTYGVGFCVSCHNTTPGDRPCCHRSPTRLASSGKTSGARPDRSQVVIGETPAHNGLETAMLNAISVCLTEQGSLSLAEVAARLGVQPRTLQRRLTRIGFTYQELVDQVRYNLARRLLASPDIPISEIAYRLGYCDPAHLSRAFCRWAGISPSAYRDRFIGQDSELARP